MEGEWDRIICIEEPRGRRLKMNDMWKHFKRKMHRENLTFGLRIMEFRMYDMVLLILKDLFLVKRSAYLQLPRWSI